jgi:hypothetical protein
LRQTHHDGGILTDRVEHDRAGEFGDHLPHNVDAFGLESPQMT